MLILTPSSAELAWRLLIPALLFVALLWMIRHQRLTVPEWLEAALSSRLAPGIAGAISAGVLLFVWRSAAAPQPVHDEQAYVLQAQIFARGRWTGEPPPIPEFFEQTHVFVEPQLASKYPPGNSLMLVPGIWAGLPGLMPLFFTAAAGGLLFAIARRLTDSWLAVLAWVLWSTSSVGLMWRASYYSQNLDTALWLLSLWALVRWTTDVRRLWLAVVACGFAAMYLTRPLTAVALGVPAAVVVFAVVWRYRLFGQTVVALALAAPVLFVNPLWHQKTTGDWRANPYSEYSRQYMPFEKPGFGADRTPPVKQATPAHIWIEREFRPLHERHQPSALPVILPARVLALGLSLGEHWRIGLACLFVWGAIRARGAIAFGVISAACLVLAHLVYAHPAQWTLYYSEAFPVFFFVAAYALVGLARAVLKVDEKGARPVVLLALILISPWVARDVLCARDQSDTRNEFQRRARSLLATLPGEPTVVFVQYPPGHSYRDSLVVNTPDYRIAPVWTVYDRGADNQRLLAMTDRTAYVLKVATWTLERIR